MNQILRDALLHPVGIGEHADIISAIDSEVEKATAAEEKLNWISNLEW